jgi:hypothetical protein
MSSSSVKPLSERVAECIEIRSRLQSFGVFVVEENNAVTAQAMNAFVIHGTGAEFTLVVPGGHGENIEFRVRLTAHPKKPSGVEMVKRI